jgi:hypothetical protein
MRPNRFQRRLALADPPPLSPDAPRFLDEQSRRFYAAEKLKAMGNMLEFDRQSEAVRHVEWVTGKVAIARKLVAQGVRTPEEAEPVVRRMLEQRPR